MYKRQALLSASFQSLPPLPTSKVGPSGADSGWVGLCTFWDPVGLSKELSCEAGSFSHCCLNHQWVFNQWVEALFPHTGALGLRGLFWSPFVPPGLSERECGTAQSVSLCLMGSTSCSLPAPVFQPLPCPESSPHSCASPPLLPVWMNVSSLSPWLSDFHTVRFSFSSGCFLFLNCCCPSLGCVRRSSMSTYASILAGNWHYYHF